MTEKVYFLFFLPVKLSYYNQSFCTQKCTKTRLQQSIFKKFFRGRNTRSSVFRGGEGGRRGKGRVEKGRERTLHDTESHKKFGPDLLLKVLMFNMHEIWLFDSQKNY